MNYATKKTYQLDLILQGIVYVPMMLCYGLGLVEQGFLILGALLQLFVGAVQVISGAVHTVKFADELHRKYFIGAIGYLAFLFLGGVVGYFGHIFMIGFLFVIPVGIATWYYYTTWQAYKNAALGEEKVTNLKIGAEDVLDDVWM